MAQLNMPRQKPRWLGSNPRSITYELWIQTSHLTLYFVDEDLNLKANLRDKP